MANTLNKENSPYLLQHANNPVHWKAWNDETLELAKRENKPLLISVGYAACHWCHVMEKESFEDPGVAEIMNRYFINIKVDREERPDIDQLYMTAVQIMTGSGGWPMNVVALPDGRPFWGGTYFRKEQWKSVLDQLGKLYREDLPKIEEYAGKLTEGMAALNMVKPPANPDLPDVNTVTRAVDQWRQYMDMTYGGRKGAPKFMMPVNLNFLLKYATLTDDTRVEDHLRTTLKKMYCGGIYDPLGGGFARYSTDERWHIPHFEMMLYDNAQLLTTYSLAYKKYRDPDYLRCIEGTYAFLTRELKGARGEFFSSLDADSLNADGRMEEGAFYTWTLEELTNALGDDLEIFRKAYNINQKGHWEHGRYVLYREDELNALASELKIPEAELLQTLEQCRNKLFELRKERPRPSLDDKSLTSWNALTITGLTDAYLATGREKYLETALECAGFVERVMMQAEGNLLHSFRNGKAAIEGFLEDYAFLTEAFLQLFQAGGGEKYARQALALCNYTLDNFFDEQNGMFSFTATGNPGLIQHTIEKSDNVIPASNSVMAHNLYTLGVIFGNPAFLRTCENMLRRMEEDLAPYGYSHANWLSLAMRFTHPSCEVAITGKGARGHAVNLGGQYLPNVITAPSEEPSSLPLLKERFKTGKTLFYVCVNNSCDLPVDNEEACLERIKSITK